MRRIPFPTSVAATSKMGKVNIDIRFTAKS